MTTFYCSCSVPSDPLYSRKKSIPSVITSQHCYGCRKI